MDPNKKDLFEKLTRAGFAARGVTYGIVGGLAFAAAIGSGGQTTGTTGALETLTGSAWGATLLVLTAIGLFGYGIFRLASAAVDMEGEGSDKKGIAKRLGYAGSGLTHFALSIYAVMLVTGNSSGGGGGGASSLTAKLMSAPAGIWLVGIAGLIGLIVAAVQVKKAVTHEYREHVELPDNQGFADRAIQIGIISRAVVFAIIGVFLIVAATNANPNQARGIGEALSWLQSQSYGGILLAIIGAGLVAFAFYNVLQARYRVVGDPSAHAQTA